MDEWSDERRKCPIRNDSGNCGCIGGFCTAVNDLICEGLRNAYLLGVYKGAKAMKNIKENLDCKNT